MPVPSGFDTIYFMQELDKRRDLCGCRVVYFDGAIMSTLRVGPPMCRGDLLAVVVRKGGKELVPTSAEIAKARDERFHAELLNLGISCGGAILAWAAAATTVGAVPLTGGTSLILTKAASVAGVVGAAQCVIAVGRVAADLYDPQINIDLDDESWYRSASAVMDAIGLAGAAITAGGTLKVVLTLRRTTGKSMLQILKGLSRQERKALTKELVGSNNQNIRNQAMQDFMKAKRLAAMPRRVDNHAINAGVRLQLLEAVGATLNVVGSTTSGLIAQAVSGGGSDELLFGTVNAYETE
jgi:hypothetical protein